MILEINNTNRATCQAEREPAPHRLSPRSAWRMPSTAFCTHSFNSTYPMPKITRLGVVATSGIWCIEISSHSTISPSAVGSLVVLKIATNWSWVNEPAQTMRRRLAALGRSWRTSDQESLQHGRLRKQHTIARIWASARSVTSTQWNEVCWGILSGPCNMKRRKYWVDGLRLLGEST